MTNPLNLKVALYFLSLIPQFILVESTAKAAALITLDLCGLDHVRTSSKGINMPILGFAGMPDVVD